MAVTYQKRVAPGSDNVHLVETAHPEGLIDGSPYALCSVKVPVAPQSDELLADKEVCPDCDQLSRGIPLVEPERELQHGEISNDEMARILAGDNAIEAAAVTDAEEAAHPAVDTVTSVDALDAVIATDADVARAEAEGMPEAPAKDAKKAK